jgi:ribulose-phosphate 3-epimerase
MTEIVPSILATTADEFQTQLKKLQGLPQIHIDIGDGQFVETKTVGFSEINSADLPAQVHVHLMIQKPEEAIDEWLKLPNLLSITFHIEATDKTTEIVNTIRAAGKFAGLALNPETAIERIESFVSSVSFVQFMTVHPGHYGSEFQPEVLEKIKTFRAKHPDTMIAVDGGVNPATAQGLVAAGANILVVGSYIMNSDSPDQAIKNLIL